MQQPPHGSGSMVQVPQECTLGVGGEGAIAESAAINYAVRTYSYVLRTKYRLDTRISTLAMTAKWTLDPLCGWRCTGKGWAGTKWAAA